jgi:serralysin
MDIKFKTEVGVPLPAFPSLVSLVYQLLITPSYSLAGAPMNVQTTYLHADYNGRVLLGNHENECYMDSSVGENPFKIDSGISTMALIASPTGAVANPCYMPYDSGMITTQGIFSCEYCYYEARLKLPKGAGLWPAFWLLSEANDGDYVGEVDVAENPQGPNTGAPSSIALHVGEQGGTPSGYSNWGLWIDTLLPAHFDPTDYHNYGVQVGPTATTFFVDRVAVATNPTPQALDVELYPIINLAVGGYGSWPGQATFTGKKLLHIEKLRVWATSDTVSLNGSPYTPPPTP